MSKRVVKTEIYVSRRTYQEKNVKKDVLGAKDSGIYQKKTFKFVKTAFYESGGTFCLDSFLEMFSQFHILL